MKRFRSLATPAVLAGAMLSAGVAANAIPYPIYLQPVNMSGLKLGSTATFNLIVDIPNTAPTYSITVGGSIAYDATIFDGDNASFATNPFFNLSPGTYTGTIGTQPVFVGAGGKTKTFTRTTVTQGGNPVVTTTTVAITPGTYTVGTFSFPVIGIPSTGKSDVFFPNAYGLDGGARYNATVITDAGSNLQMFDTSPGTSKPARLTGTFAPAPSSLLVLAMGGVPLLALRRRLLIKKR